ncbi:thioesterase II family protein [Streptomyces sp. NPDC005551]|uniref:thioesterase II family protein n=1 Tax=Streptomyces sp. NPDC005551 TaxID=3364725 RepID=UPI0036B935E8
MTGDERSVVIFPGAGSFGGEFRALGDVFGARCTVVRYPGRTGRDAGKPPDSFDAVVASCTEQITGLPGTRPVLFGHSYGAYVAYATALVLAGSGVEVDALVVAGASAPDLLRVPPGATDSPEAAAAYLAAVDPGQWAATAPEWREVVAETVQQDLALLAGFTPSAPPARVPCPVLAVRGAEDPLADDASVGQWRRFTRTECVQRTFAGGHSGLLASTELTGWLRAELGVGAG